MYTMPKFCTVDETTEICDKLEGVTLRTLGACDTIHMRTHNHEYEIFLLDPDSVRAMVQGGEYFTEPMEAAVSGSSFGGCMLKMGWLGVGLRVEIFANGQRTVTSPVQSLRVEQASIRQDLFDFGERNPEENCMPIN